MSPFLFAGLFAAWAALMAAYPVFPPIARQLGLSELQTGLLISLSAVLMAIASPFWGNLSERWGRKPVFLIGIFGAAGSIFVFAVVLQLGLEGLLAGTALFALLIAARMPIGLLVAAAPVAAQAYVADTTDAENRSSALAKIGAANALGLIAGPAAAAFLVLFGLLVPFYAGAALVALIGVILLVTMPESPKRASRGSHVTIRLLDGRIWPFLLVGFAAVMLVSLVQVSIGFFLMDRFDLPVSEAAQTGAVAFLVVGIALVAVQGVLIPWMKWAPARLLRLGLPVMAMGFACLLAAPAIWGVYGAFVVMGFGAGMAFPGFQAGITLAVGDNEQGAVAGLTGTANASGAVFGPLAGTALYQVGPNLPYWAALFVLVALSVFVWLNRQVSAAVPPRR